jgi:riboflavin biosynthesis pyrimidine reductase
MIALTPLETLVDIDRGTTLPLPPELAALYGRLQFPLRPGQPFVISNFVTTLDGVVSLNVPGHAGGGDISGRDQHDRMVMGVLRAVADAVIVGAGTLRAASPQHLWTAEYIYPPLTDAYKQLRAFLKKPDPPLNVIVSARGAVDLKKRVFQSGEVPVLIVTTKNAEHRVRQDDLPPWVQVAAIESAGPLDARSILEAVGHVRQSDVILVEGGPHLMADFLAQQCVDELFLTLAPQIAGRDDLSVRPGLVAGKSFAPKHPLWGTLIEVKRGGSHLFLRYSLESARDQP